MTTMILMFTNGTLKLTPNSTEEVVNDPNCFFLLASSTTHLIASLKKNTRSVIKEDDDESHCPWCLGRRSIAGG